MSCRVVDSMGFVLAEQFVAKQAWEASSANMLIYRKDLVERDA